jgi:hypothetical protein
MDLLLIFSNLDFKDFLEMSLVCRKWKNFFALEGLWKWNFESLSKMNADKINIKSSTLPFKTWYYKRRQEEKRWKMIENYSYKTEKSEIKFIEMNKFKSVHLNKPPTITITKEEEDFLSKEDPEQLKKNQRKIKGASKKKN